MNRREVKDSKIEKIYQWDGFPFLCMFLIYFLLHSICFTWMGDDFGYKEGIPFDIADFFEKRLTWSSRLLLDVVIYFLLTGLYDFNSLFIWIILDSLMFVLIAISIKKFFKLIFQYENRRFSWIIVGCILIFPLRLVSGAGWIWTSGTYIWPIAIGLYVLVNYVESMYIQKKGIRIVLYSIGIIYATNMECSSVMFFIFFLGILVMEIINKKIWYEGMWYTILCAISIIWHVVSPGNASRMVSETVSYFPNYGMLSVVDKIELAFSKCIYHFIYGDSYTTILYNTTFLLFSILLFIAIMNTCKDVYYRIIGSIPLLASIVFSVIPKLGLFQNLSKIQYLISQEGTITVNNYDELLSYLPILLGLLVSISIIISMYIFNSNDLKKFIMIVLGMIGGIASWMIMAFSPTIWASGERPFCDLYFMFLALCIYLSYILMESDKKNKEYALPLIGFLALLNCLDMILF